MMGSYISWVVRTILNHPDRFPVLWNYSNICNICYNRSDLGLIYHDLFLPGRKSEQVLNVLHHLHWCAIHLYWQHKTTLGLNLKIFPITKKSRRDKIEQNRNILGNTAKIFILITSLTDSKTIPNIHKVSQNISVL